MSFNSRAFLVNTLFLIVIGVQPSQAELPADASQLLKTFPDRAISLDLVVGRALSDAETFKQIKATALLSELPHLQALAPLDWRLSLKTDWTRIQNEQFTPYAPQESRSLINTLGVQKYFSSGTGLGVELSHGRSELRFTQAGIPPGYYESRLGVQLSQKLWQDAFGNATRRSLESGILAKEASLLGVRAKSEDYVRSLIGVFYEAWLAKARVKAAVDNVSRRQRLARIMNIKVQRGTAEEPERLQVASALSMAETQEDEARQNLRDQWYALVLTLKLPESWLEIDPYEVPIVLDEPMLAAEAKCEKVKEVEKNYRATAVIRAEKESAAAELQYEAAKDSLRPNLELTAKAIANGINLSDRNATVGEATDFEHPGYLVGLQLTMPWSHYQEQIRVRQALTEQQRAKAAVVDVKDQWRKQWRSGCDNLVRLKSAEKRSSQSYEAQEKRARLEENRYSIGRTSILAVSQAGDDATATELGWRQTQVALRLTAWEVQRLSNGYEKYLKGTEQ